MKKLLFLGLITFSAYAEELPVLMHYFNPKEPGKLYLDKKACPDNCFEAVVDGKLIGATETLVLKNVTEEVCSDDQTKPIFGPKSNEIRCSGIDECWKALSALECKVGHGYIDEKFSEVYCAEVRGYEQQCKDVTSEKLVVDEKKKAELDRVLAAKQAEEETAKKTKEERVERLKNFDIDGVKDIEELKSFLKDLRDSGGISGEAIRR